jgi:hypothetical protein
MEEPDLDYFGQLLETELDLSIEKAGKTVGELIVAILGLYSTVFYGKSEIKLPSTAFDGGIHQSTAQISRLAW